MHNAICIPASLQDFLLRALQQLNAALEAKARKLPSWHLQFQSSPVATGDRVKEKSCDCNSSHQVFEKLSILRSSWCYEASKFPARSSSKELQVGSIEGAAIFPALQLPFVGQVVSMSCQHLPCTLEIQLARSMYIDEARGVHCMSNIGKFQSMRSNFWAAFGRVKKALKSVWFDVSSQKTHPGMTGHWLEVYHQHQLPVLRKASNTIR